MLRYDYESDTLDFGIGAYPRYRIIDRKNGFSRFIAETKSRDVAQQIIDALNAAEATK